MKAIVVSVLLCLLSALVEVHSQTVPYVSFMGRAGASGPVGPVLAGPILREKVGVFIPRLHVGVAARSIVT